MREYLTTLFQDFGQGWNRFWFSPARVAATDVLRWLVGGSALLLVLSYTTSLIAWFGPDGLLPATVIGELYEHAVWRVSLLAWIEQPWQLWLFHTTACLIVLAFTIGWQTRWVKWPAWIMVLSYIHRAPLLNGPVEPILAFLMLYLCLAPCGQSQSLDSLLRRRRDDSNDSKGSVTEPPMSWRGNLSLRLIQVHVAGYYLLMGLSQLGGTTWWDGQASWVLIAQVYSRPVDLSFLRASPVLLNLWTHGIVAFELLFGVLIWIERARPLLLSMAVFFWVSIFLLSGWLLFGVLMLIGSLSFVSAAGWDRMMSRFARHASA